MNNRKVFFSILMLIAVIFGGVLHGPAMAYAKHLEDMDDSVAAMSSPGANFSDLQHQTMHHDEFELAAEGAIEITNRAGNSLMPCCDADSFSVEKRGIFHERKSETLNLESVLPEGGSNVLDEIKKFNPEIVYEYFSPPEETILASVIRIE